MMQYIKLNRIIAVMVAAAFAFLQIPAAAAANPVSEKPGNITGHTLADIIKNKYPENSYTAYISRFSDAPVITGIYKLDKNNSDTVYEVSENGGILFKENYEIKLKANIKVSGLYGLVIEYLYDDIEDIKNSDLSIKIDGEVPFYEANEFELPRIWTQKEIVHVDSSNDLLPESYQVREKSAFIAGDVSGYNGNYLFYLEQGERTISFSSKLGGFEILSVALGSPEIKSYSDIKDSQNSGFCNEIVTVQAEDIFRKNSSSISAGYDRSDASIVPSDPVYKKLNVIDGSRFNMPTQKVTWKFTVKKAGKYKIGIKFKQDSLQGLFVCRTLRINDVVPCKELENIKFTYDNDWQYALLSANDQSIYLDFEPGDYSLSLEVTLGDYREYVKRIDEAVFALNYLYRKIIMVTSTSPDPFRDYNLQNEIPYLIPSFKELIGELTDIYNGLSDLIGTKSGQISVINQLISQLKGFVDNPYDIQDRLSSYQSNISSLSSLISVMLQQPLSIDYISLISSEENDSYAKSGFLKNAWYIIRGIIGSFMCDYSAVGGVSDTDYETIRVWFSGGREQAELLKTIIDSSFTPTKKISVNLQLVVMPLAQSILAGNAPDVALTTSRTQPVNFGARGVVEDLTKFDGFDSVKEIFDEHLLKPYTYKNGVYALPVTLDYFMMFYREDILKELNVNPPRTWDEFYEIIPIIQRENMSIGLPYTAMSSQTTIESGIGAKDLFATLILQNDVQLYNDELTKINLSSDGVVSIFKQWTEFYKLYQLDLQFDFYNRFRSGEMPLAIQNYSAYNLLASAAPEIRGLWKMTAIPGVKRPDGSINNAVAASGAGTVLLSSSKNKGASWEFIKWWASVETQARYGNELEIHFGTASRYNPASSQAMALLPWKADELEALMSQRKMVYELPEVLGGYYVARGLDNAFRGVVISKKNYRELLRTQEIAINAEFARKQAEFNKK